MEYLFRGKRLGNGEWAYGYPFEDTNGRACIITGMIKKPNVAREPLLYDVVLYWVDRETVGQYTGLFDQKCELIFAGDILYSEGHTNMRGLHEVIYDNFTAAFMLKKVGSNDVTSMSETDCKCLRVIGNRWDNPELLEVAKEDTES